MGMAELLREGLGQADATSQLLKGYALQPVAGLAGASRGLADLLRGKGKDAALQGAVDTIEGVQGWGGGPRTERGAQRLNELGSMVGGAVDKVGDALGNPIDKLGEVSPAMAAGALGFMDVADPTKVLGKGKRIARQAVRHGSKAEAVEQGFWHPVGLGKKLDKPYDEMTSVTQQLRNDIPERKVISLEDLQNEWLIPAPGDRTAANRLLTQVEGIDLQDPVHLEGGADFMRTHQGEGSVWASKKSALSKLRNMAVENAAETGDASNLIYLPMGMKSMNFSTMPVETALQMMRSGKIGNDALGEFDTAVRQLRPDFAGVKSQEVLKQLRNGEIRHAMMDRMALKQFKEQGFPDLAAIRKAIMEPDLADVPNMAGGYAIGRVDHSKPMIEAKDQNAPHRTYDTQLAGEYRGGLDVNVDYKDLFPDYFAERRAAGGDEAGDLRSFSLSKPRQRVTQEYLDRIMPIIEQLRAGQ